MNRNRLFKPDLTTMIRKDNNDEIDIRELMEKHISLWKWYILSVAIFGILAFLYLRYTSNQYEVSSIILIDDKSVGGIESEISAFQDLQLMGGAKTSVVNEIGVLKSRTLLERVVKELNLNIAYFHKGRVKDAELYDSQIPFKIIFFVADSILHNNSNAFIISPFSNNEYYFKNFKGEIVKKGIFGRNITTDFGEINITPVDPNRVNLEEEILVKIYPVDAVVEKYRNRIIIEEETYGSSLLVIKLIDNLRLRGIHLIDNLVDQYNKQAIDTKTAIAKNTNDFINERLGKISLELSQVDSNVEEFKQRNRLVDPSEGASIILQSNSAIEKQIVDLNSEIKLVDFIIDYINSNPGDLIPANLGINGFEGNTDAYNNLIMQRNRIISVSSELNPTVINLDTQIATLKQSLDQSLTNRKTSLEFSLYDMRNQESKLNSRLYSAPKQERQIRDIKRQQEISETLYLYLLQKREENAIAFVGIAPNSKVIDAASGSYWPISPNSKMIYVLGIIIGFIFPFLVITGYSLIDNKIHSVDQLEKTLMIPILGDVPKSKHRIIRFEKDGSSSAEAFRLLRTNLAFMFPALEQRGRIIFVTSTIGGEGKSYVSINLASVLASNNEKVLLIGADLRKPKLDKYLDLKAKKGLSNYLVDRNLQIPDILVSDKKLNFDMINSGEVPPNPSELLMSDRLGNIFDFGKNNYDYIIVDTPPVSLVSDTLVMGKSADLTIYVIRANFLDKRLLRTTEALYDKERFSNMALLLNASKSSRTNYGYGYGYGG